MHKIPLTQGKYAIVDECDYKWLNQWKWCALKDKGTYYAGRAININGKGKLSRMHREIMQALPTMQVDHINHNGLDNRRSNLRLCTATQNQWNPANQKGVCWHKKAKKWVARIRHYGKRFHLGSFKTKEEAHIAYKTACRKFRNC